MMIIVPSFSVSLNIWNAASLIYKVWSLYTTAKCENVKEYILKRKMLTFVPAARRSLKQENEYIKTLLLVDLA